MTTSLKVEGVEKVLRVMESLTPRMFLRAVKLVKKVTFKVEARTKQKLSGEVLNVRTGRLRRSINSQFREASTWAEGTVGTNVEYARIHEFGGTTRAHLIAARNGKALRFQLHGKDTFRRSVLHPGSKIPERSFLRSSLRELGGLLDELKAG